jgi:RPA family protein
MERSVARKIPVNEILTGTFVKRPGWEPSGILTKYGEISRVNIVGLIVSLTQTDTSGNFLIDDGTGNITVRYFESNPVYNALKVGDIIRLIARVRENQNSIYLVPECISQTDKRWHQVHTLELKISRNDAVKLPVEQAEDEEAGPYQKILNIIAMMDEGQGAEVEDILKAANIQDGDSVIRSLLAEGEIFEISPGKMKVLN